MTIPLHNKVPAYVLAVFDDAGATAGGASGGAASSSGAAAGEAGAGDGGATGGTPAGSSGRDGRGRFTPIQPRSDDPAELRRALEEANRIASSAHDRIGELNSENLKHRNRLNETRTQLEGISSQVTASNQRVIRAEARDALRDAGVINPRVVDLFLADMGDKVTIDPKTGEPTGITQNLGEWQKANPDFFKVATAAPDGAAAGATGAAAGAAAATGASGAAGAAASGASASGKGNATATGGSVAGGEGGSSTVKGLPDLRKMSAEDRRVAMQAYRQSLRVGGGR